MTNLFDLLAEVKAAFVQVRHARSLFMQTTDRVARVRAHDALIIADENLYRALEKLDRANGLAALLNLARAEDIRASVEGRA